MIQLDPIKSNQIQSVLDGANLLAPFDEIDVFMLDLAMGDMVR